MIMLRVFFEANRIRLHTGRPRAGFFLSSSILASASPLAPPGPSSAAHRGATRTLARRGDADQRGSATASIARQEGPAAAAPAPPVCSGSAHDAGAREEAMPNCQDRSSPALLLLVQWSEQV